MPRIAILVLIGAIASLAACKQMPSVSTPVKELQGPAPVTNSTPISELLACFSSKGKSEPFRLAVNDLIDGTGVTEGDSTNSRAITQRPDLMMVSALAQAGVTILNRNSVGIAEWEMKGAIERKLGEGKSVKNENEEVQFRPVKVGSFVGSTHYVTGAITELNWNIGSAAAEIGAYSVSAGARVYRISIALDIMVTNTITTEIVHARSYKKQLVGYETSVGAFRFMYAPVLTSAMAPGMAKALELFNANLGNKKNEPVQTAVRWLIELSAYDIVRSLTNSGGDCDSLLPPDTLSVKPARVSIVKPATAQAPQTLDARAPGQPVKVAANQSRPAPDPVAGQRAGQQPAPRSSQETRPPQIKQPADHVTLNDGDAFLVFKVAEDAAQAKRSIAELAGAEFIPILPERRRIVSLAIPGTKLFRVGMQNVDGKAASVVCFRMRVAGEYCDVLSRQQLAAEKENVIKTGSLVAPGATRETVSAPVTAEPGDHMIVLASARNGTAASAVLADMRGRFNAELQSAPLRISRDPNDPNQFLIVATGLSERAANTVCFRVKVSGGECEVRQGRRTEAQRVIRRGQRG